MLSTAWCYRMGKYAGSRARPRRVRPGTVNRFGCAAAALDITERKQAELEAARHRNEMAHLSRVTTLGELSGSLAHELNPAARRHPQQCAGCTANARQVATSTSPSFAKFLMNRKRKQARRRSHPRLRLWLQKGEVQQHSLRINKVVRDVLKLIRTDLISQNVSVDTELAREFAHGHRRPGAASAGLSQPGGQCL